MQDYMIRATAADGMVRAFAAVTTNMVKEAKQTHGLTPVASAALGRTITAAAMMSGLLKGEKDTMTIQVKGDGPLGGIIAVTDSRAKVRGYVHNPDVDLPLNARGKLDVSTAIGGGYLNVIKDLGLKEPYIGYVKLVSGEIAEDLAYYFASSEQVPTVIALGVLVGPDADIVNAGGFMLQLMPEASEGLISYLEFRLEEIPPVSQLLAEGNTPEDILKLIFNENDVKINDKIECKYTCNCSRERMERNILSLGKQEIIEMIEEQHGAEAQCHFCNQTYQFTEEELGQMINEVDE